VSWRWLSVAAIAVCVAGAVSLDRTFPPDLSRLASRATIVRDRYGDVLALRPAPGGVWRFDTDADAVPPLLVDLLIATEDKRFRWHPGIDPLAAMRAAGQMMVAGHVVSGGSTLTMQVARLLEPRPRGIIAKLSESLRAIQLTERYSKRQVLGLWLSLAPFGGNLVGVEAASRAWFGKPAKSLDAAEAALLVALPRRPEGLRPDRFPERAKRVRDQVLDAAERGGLLSAAEATEARAEPVPTRRAKMPDTAKSLLAQMPGDVTTTLDGPLQLALDAFAATEASRLPEHVAISIMIADAGSRAIRAASTAGGAGPPDFSRAVRSPGSTLKPVLYALAFEDGIATPDTVLMDAPRRFGSYVPEDMSRRFAGPVTATEALRRSLNLPAVALLDRFGPLKFAAALAPAGLRLPRGAAGALPLILGGGGMTLRGLVGVYAAIATDGRLTPVHVRPADAGAPGPLLTAAAAEMVADILTRPFPAGGSGGGGPDGIAWKTGTSAAGRDAWALGFDRTHVVGVWIGRPDGTAQAGVVAADLALPVFSRVFALLQAAPRPAGTVGRPATIGPAATDTAITLLYPPPDAALSGTAPVTLRARGGIRPLSFLVDGAALPSQPALRAARWTPPGPGFYTLTVEDTAGHAARAAVRVLPDAGDSARP